MSFNLFGHKETQEDQKIPPTTEAASSASAQISADNSVKEWLAHPTGGAIFRDMLATAGQNESVLKPVHRLSLKRLVSMSQGRFTEEMVNDMVKRANSGEMPATTTPHSPGEVSSAPQDIELPLWKETITPGRFNGKTIIITGAGSGIGRATASRVAREGGRVIGVDISAERLQEFKASLPETNITIVTGDITKDEDIVTIIEAAGSTIDGLANVAGIMDNMTPLHEVSDEIWNRVMGINVTGMMKLSRAVLPKMLERHAGSIVNIGSEASIRGSAAGAAYTASKHAVVGLTKSSAFMYGPSGIRVNAVAPGAVLTNIEAKYDSQLGGDRVNELLATIPAAAEADQLAASITFLLSDDGVNLNGVLLPSDGGWSAQ